MGCQTAIAEQIVEQGGDYVLALKRNPGKLYAAVEQAFATASATPSEASSLQDYETDDAKPGRVEIRRPWTLDVPDGLEQKEAWSKLSSLGRGESERQCNGKVTIEQRYYVASIASDPQCFASAVRGHWGIANCVHWVLDVAFREDESRIRTGHAPANSAVLRHIALNLLRQDTTSKMGMQNRRLKAGWDETYLAKLVFAEAF